MHRRLRVATIATLLVALLAPLGTRGSAHDAPRVYLVVIDGLEPGDVGPELTPNIHGLIEGGRARSYTAAQAMMVTETNGNHTAMVTGAWGEATGIVANSFLDTTSSPPVKRPLDRPSLLLSETLFDSIARQQPRLRTGAVMGKSKLRNLFSATDVSTENPEGEPVSHTGPDHMWGAKESPDRDALIQGADNLAEPGTGSGYAHDTQTMNSALRMIEQHDPHFMFVSLSNVDGFQHLFGATSPQGRAAIVNADLQVGRLVSALQANGTWDRSVVVVTADHSFQGSGNPVGTSALGGSPAGPDVDHSNQLTPRVTGTTILLPDLVGSCPGTPLGWVSHGGSASVYLTDLDRYAPDAELTPLQSQCLRTVRQRVTANPGVDGAWYRLPAEGGDHLLDAKGWNLQSPRIGELFIAGKDPYAFLESQTSSASITSGVHGGESTRPVPFVIASGGETLRAGTDDRGVSPVDVAPTISWLLDRDPPADSVGRVLLEAFEQRP
ncbi:MAG TPA: alkaline phosphatase family protein [Actinomycetota bacterium]|nr:alkaline phosphatase family protein [Actinomycetota bacterium]